MRKSLRLQVQGKVLRVTLSACGVSDDGCQGYWPQLVDVKQPGVYWPICRRRFIMGVELLMTRTR